MKNVLKLGKALSKAEQKQINGGSGGCVTNECFCQGKAGWYQIPCTNTCPDGSVPFCF